MLNKHFYFLVIIFVPFFEFSCILSFFGSIKTLLRNATAEEVGSIRSQKWFKPEMALHASIEKCQASVRAALSDNFDYPTAM